MQKKLLKINVLLYDINKIRNCAIRFTLTVEKFTKHVL